MFRLEGFKFQETENRWALATRLLSHKRVTKTSIVFPLMSALHQVSVLQA